jgi:plastocyanin
MKLIPPTLAGFGLLAALLAPGAAFGATPVVKGTDGPGFTITVKPKPTKVGKVKLVVADKSSIHNFHLVGPGVNVKTSVGGVGKKTFLLKLRKGTYRFVCDPHRTTMKGSFTIKK